MSIFDTSKRNDSGRNDSAYCPRGVIMVILVIALIAIVLFFLFGVIVLKKMGLLYLGFFSVANIALLLRERRYRVKDGDGTYFENVSMVVRQKIPAGVEKIREKIYIFHGTWFMLHMIATICIFLHAKNPKYHMFPLTYLGVAAFILMAVQTYLSFQRLAKIGVDMHKPVIKASIRMRIFNLVSFLVVYAYIAWLFAVLFGLLNAGAATG